MCPTRIRDFKMRKIVILLVIIIGFGISANAQDVITLKNGTDIKALVQKIDDIEIEYKKFDNPNGPNYTLKKAEILMIRYANGSKDIFSEEAKPIETKEVSNPETESLKQNEDIEANIETVYLPENMQSRKDVIVRGLNSGFQTKITNIDNKYIHYIRYKKNGKEKDKKIKQKHVFYTLSFTEKAKQEMYPLEMNLQDFLSLPIYSGWTVFGMNGMTNLPYVRQLHPDIYKDYMKGEKQYRKGSTISLVGGLICPLGVFPGCILSIVGSSISLNGMTNMDNATMDYRRIHFNPKVLDKYGIVVTPYSGNPLIF